MPKRIFWEQTVIETGKLSDWLTTHNLQPNKFKICYMQENIVLVVYIDKEIPNEE